MEQQNLTVHSDSQTPLAVTSKLDSSPADVIHPPFCGFEEQRLALRRAHAASVAELDPPNRGVSTDAHTVNREACRGAAGTESPPQSDM